MRKDRLANLDIQIKSGLLFICFTFGAKSPGNKCGKVWKHGFAKFEQSISSNG